MGWICSTDGCQHRVIKAQWWEWRCGFMPYQRRKWTEVKGQILSGVALSRRGKNPSVPIGQEGEWALERSGRFGEETKSCPCREFSSHRFSGMPVRKEVNKKTVTVIFGCMAVVPPGGEVCKRNTALPVLA